MTNRDQLHELVDKLGDVLGDSAKLHARIDALDVADLPDEFDRLESLRLLFEQP
jgi:hypothetical protein